MYNNALDVYFNYLDKKMYIKYEDAFYLKLIDNKYNQIYYKLSNIELVKLINFGLSIIFVNLIKNKKSLIKKI